MLEVRCNCGKTAMLKPSAGGVYECSDPTWVYHTSETGAESERLWNCGEMGHWQHGLRHVPPRPELEEALELAEAASPGPWHADSGWGEEIYSADHWRVACISVHDGEDGERQDEANIAFVAQSRTLLPAVCKYALALEAERDARAEERGRLREIIEAEARDWDGRALDCDPDSSEEHEWRMHCRWKADWLRERLARALLAEGEGK